MAFLKDTVSALEFKNPFLADTVSANIRVLYCTYDTFMAEDLTIDMIPCQEQL